MEWDYMYINLNIFVFVYILFYFKKLLMIMKWDYIHINLNIFELLNYHFLKNDVEIAYTHPLKYGRHHVLLNCESIGYSNHTTFYPPFFMFDIILWTSSLTQ